MSKVLVTGATGFLGSYVARYLILKGHSVYATRRQTSRMDLVADIQSQIKWTTCDLTDSSVLEDIIAEVDDIIHCAAVVSFQPKDIQKMYEVNVEGTKDLVDLSLEHKINRFIHISSIAALGKHKHDKLIDENVEWQDNPINTEYGISKQLSEREVWRGHAEGMDICILNPSLILGAGFWDMGSPALIKQVNNGNPFYPTGSTGVVDVRDVAKLAVLALQSDVSGERFIISGENISYRSIFEKTALQLNKKLPSIKLTSLLIALLWRADAILSLLPGRKRLATKETLHSSARDTKYKTSKSIETFKYTYLDIDQTIAESCKAYHDSINSKRNSSFLAFPTSF